MLIAGQRPDATRVAGYSTWQTLKRQFRERGIMIFAPCPFKREVETSNGNTEEREGMFFRAVHVFDVAKAREVAVSFGALSGGTLGVSK